MSENVVLSADTTSILGRPGWTVVSGVNVVLTRGGTRLPEGVEEVHGIDELKEYLALPDPAAAIV